MAAAARGAEAEVEGVEGVEGQQVSTHGDSASRRTSGTDTAKQQSTVDGSRRSNATMASVSNLVDFRGTYDGICRGVPVDRVLAGAGALLAEAKGSSATFSFSSPVAQLFAFVSHNWATPRSKKYLTLVLHFNFNVAFVTSLSLLLLLGAGNFMGWLPTVTDIAWEQPAGILCRLLYVPLFFVCLFLRYEISSRLGFRSHRVFLDKACIHQTDPQKMAVGIRKLGAFLNVSSRMVVVYTDLYLTKVWTVYEVACFLATHRVEQLDVAHVQESFFFLAGVTVAFIFGVFSLILRLRTEVFLSTALPLVLSVYGAGLVLRSGARAQHEALRRLERFSVRSCTCAVESDRPIVYENIAVLMAAKGWISADAELDTALDAFDGLVRERLPGAFRRGVGFSHDQVLMLSTAFALTFTLDHITGISFGIPTRVVVAYALPGFITCFFTVPLVFFLGSQGVKLRLDVTGWRAQCIVLPVCVGILLVYFFFYTLVNMWAEVALESDAAFAALIATATACTLFHVARLCWVRQVKTTTARHDAAQRITFNDSGNVEEAAAAQAPEASLPKDVNDVPGWEKPPAGDGLAKAAQDEWPGDGLAKAALDVVRPPEIISVIV